MVKQANGSRIVKVKHEPSSRGAEGYTSYATADGRFTIEKGYGRGWPNNTYWQVRAMDGSTPFRGMRGANSMAVDNFESFADAREAVADAYESAQPAEVA